MECYFVLSIESVLKKSWFIGKMAAVTWCLQAYYNIQTPAIPFKNPLANLLLKHKIKRKFKTLDALYCWKVAQFSPPPPPPWNLLHPACFWAPYGPRGIIQDGEEKEGWAFTRVQLTSLFIFLQQSLRHLCCCLISWSSSGNHGLSTQEE